jgi:hypothetical protein
MGSTEAAETDGRALCAWRCVARQVTRTKASAAVDYHALAAQLMAQRDAKQEALHEVRDRWIEPGS